MVNQHVNASDSRRLLYNSLLPVDVSGDMTQILANPGPQPKWQQRWEVAHEGQVRSLPDELAWGERVSHSGTARVDGQVCVYERLGCSSREPTCWQGVVLLLICQWMCINLRILSESV